MNVRTVKYRFAWCSLRKVAVGRCQVEVSTRSVTPFRVVCKSLPGRILIALLVTTSFLANNVATELIIPGSSPIRMLARSLVTSYLSMVWPKTEALPRLIPAHDRRRLNQDWQSVRSKDAGCEDEWRS